MMQLRSINSNLRNNLVRGCVLLGLMIIFGLFFSWNELFELVGVPMGPSLFNDSRVITAGAESYYLGFDPLLDNPMMPTKNVMNYPRIWHSLLFWGLNQDHTIIFGMVMVVLYLIGLSITMSVGSRSLGWVLVAFCATSPASLLAIERGNVDLLIFFFIVVAVVFLVRLPILSAGLLVFSTMLKLFPVFCLPVILMQVGGRRGRLIFGLSLVVCAAYFTIIHSDLLLINAGTPRPLDLAYGKNVFFGALSNYLNKNFELWSWLAVLVAFSSSYFIGKYWINIEPQELSALEGKGLFVAGSFIFAGTFIIGNNWDYRLIFLILTIPCAVSLICVVRDSLSKRFMCVYVSAVILLFWYLFLQKWVGITPPMKRLIWLLDEFSSWVVLALCLSVAFKIFPWFFGFLNNVDSNLKCDIE